ncbi:uncharacterized protein FIBRA_00552 [Fibroporia radiculosa]|uniref:Pyridoxamine 5'-phosphate oxidase Alr4036 family FMN-binding domain-containing protein n=1 Tax=Fibroporia radiculosa TaxID=599839 RepID=J4HRS9_9APHY|nr:uncharacterized protein FIBRA_00552 [Fibroporia radiculosa]CCL98552.1 predicted protein [Fibroporia radiculosa]
MASKPRWRSGLENAMALPENKGQMQYQLATVDTSGRPHVRTVGFSSIIEPAEHPHLPVLIGITDVRTPKVTDMRANPYVELCWFLTGSKDQFRISGPVRIIPSPHVESAAQGESTLALDKLSEQGFDWEKKRVAAFDSLPPFMRALWCKPPQGSTIGSYEVANEWLKTLSKSNQLESEEDKQNFELALRNFALLVIDPIHVDWVEAAASPQRRTKFMRNGEDWSEEFVVP